MENSATETSRALTGGGLVLRALLSERGLAFLQFLGAILFCLAF